MNRMMQSLLVVGLLLVGAGVTLQMKQKSEAPAMPPAVVVRVLPPSAPASSALIDTPAPAPVQPVTAPPPVAHPVKAVPKHVSPPARKPAPAKKVVKKAKFLLPGVPPPQDTGGLSAPTVPVPMSSGTLH